jgi:hypothetical protein
MHRGSTPNVFSLSPKRVSLSPNVFSLSPNAFSLSPNAFSLSPNAFSLSPNRVSLSPNRVSLSPNLFSLSPNLFSLSPNLFCRAAMHRGSTVSAVFIKKHLCLPRCVCGVPNTAYREAVGTVVVVAVHVGVVIVEVPAPRVRTTVGRRTPEVGVGASIVEVGASVVAITCRQPPEPIKPLTNRSNRLCPAPSCAGGAVFFPGARGAGGLPDSKRRARNSRNHSDSGL